MQVGKAIPAYAVFITTKPTGVTAYGRPKRALQGGPQGGIGTVKCVGIGG